MIAYRPIRHSPGQSGYGLVEMLIAAVIGILLVSVLLHFAVSVQTSIAVQGDIADLQQRLRVAMESLRHDVMLAGAGPARGAARGPLVRVFAPIVPARTGVAGADPELSFHSDRISMMYVPDTHPQTSLIADMSDPGSPVAITGNAPGCPAAAACDFKAGDDVLIFEAGGAGGAHEVFRVAAVDTVRSTLAPSFPLSRTYASGSRIAVVVQRTYHLDRIGKRLMVYDGARSDVPLVDHVVDLSFAYYGDPRPDVVAPPRPGAWNCAYTGLPPAPLLTNLGGNAPKLLSDSVLTDGPVCGQAPYRFDADLLRIRRVAITMRLETESAGFRGQGAAFATPGFSRAATKAVADLQATIEVAPRNMAR
jgi:type II secretory pathway pseudopilin PulG